MDSCRILLVSLGVQKKLKKSETSWSAVALFVIALLCIGSLLLVKYLNKPKGQYATITNTEFGFSVEYPTKWHAQIHGETGYKGERDVRLRIYRYARNPFRISVHQKPAKNPSLDDAAEWGSRQIQENNNHISKLGDPELMELAEIFFQQEDMVGGKTIARRRYAGNGIIYEDVYFARETDMIIITLQAPEEYFESYLDDFDAIVNSFSPLE
jgi:hypothetical protein